MNRWAVPAAGTLIAAAAVVAYHNSLSGPFLFDDRLSIRDNPTIRQLWPLWGALAPPSGRGLTVEGRPVLNLSFAVNYAIGGTQVWSYHALNLLIHVLAGLTLFGIVRRTLAGRTRATDCAFMVALLWTVHPVQTESVTYVVQRAESLMGLFYLFTLYAFIRATEPGARVGWAALAVSSCLLGMATKEVMVSAPLIVFLYDRTFVSASFRGAWRRHRGLHLALASTWIVLAWLAAGAGNRGGTSGAGIGVGALTYWESQFQAVARYLWLSVYPQPLIFDYGTEWPQSAWQIVPDAVVVAGLVIGTIWALRRRPALGFLGFFFFAVLAPTSLVPGNRQSLAEHRMYLALAPLLAAIVLGLYQRLGRRAAVALLVVAAGLGALTVRRNEDYRSELALYGDTVAKRPGNAFARYNLGKVLDEAGDSRAAIPQYEAAIRLRPDLVDSYYNLGNSLTGAGRLPEAIAQYEAALRLKPDMAEAHYNLGNTLVRLGRKAEAAEHYEAALRIKPDYVEAQDNLGSVFLDLGRLPEAIAQYQAVLRINPGVAETHCNLGTIYRLLGREGEANEEFRRALRIDPNFLAARKALLEARGRAQP